MANGTSWTDLIEGEVVDCGTISINYQTNGIAQIAFTVYRPKDEGPPYTSGSPSFSMCAGGVNFKGWVMEQSLAPASDIDMHEWRVTAQAIGCALDDSWFSWSYKCQVYNRLLNYALQS